MTPEQLAVIDNFKCDNCGKCEACLLIEEFVANEKILKKKGTPDERLVVEFADKFVKIPCTSHAGTEWVPDPDISKWLHVTFAQIREDERGKMKPKTRREILSHSNDCPMQNGEYLDCRCHYADCLDYSGIKYSGVCVCDHFTAKNKWATYEMSRLSKPWYKRMWMKKYHYTHFLTHLAPTGEK
jgi:hypothetical protein